MSWRDEPVTKGELYDALHVVSANLDRKRKALEDVTANWRSGRLFRETVHITLTAVTDLAREVAKQISGEN